MVRCLAHKADAFVFTDSPARIEPEDENHTVRVAFDDEPDATQRWMDSEEHDALFAPDGAAFARRLAQSAHLRFGFTPHNAPPVTSISAPADSTKSSSAWPRSAACNALKHVATSDAAGACRRPSNY